jgi:hypothetical protein
LFSAQANIPAAIATTVSAILTTLIFLWLNMGSVHCSLAKPSDEPLAICWSTFPGLAIAGRRLFYRGGAGPVASAGAQELIGSAGVFSNPLLAGQEINLRRKQMRFSWADGA